MVKIEGTACYNTKSLYILRRKVKIQNRFQTGKTGCVCVVEGSLKLTILQLPL